MKTKVFCFTLFMACLACFPVSLHSQTTVNLGYKITEDYIWQYDGFYVTADMRAGAAILVKKSMYASYIGATVKSLRIGWGDPERAGKATLFARTVLNDPETNFAISNECTIKNDNRGSWNICAFTEPFELTDSLGDFYVGYYADLKANQYAFSTVYPHNQAGAAYLWRDEAGYNYDANGHEIWEDQHANGTLAIQIVLTVDTDANKDKATIVSLVVDPVQKTGARSSGLMVLSNQGTNVINTIEVTTSLGDEKRSETARLSSALGVASQGTVVVPIYGVGTGDVNVSVTKVNGKANGVNTSVTRPVLSIAPEVAANYTRRSLAEFFESESSYYVPTYYDKYFYPGYEKYKDRVSLVAHHLNDQFMTGDDEETVMMLAFARGDSSQIYLPSQMIDRTPQFQYSSLGCDIPFTSIVLPDFSGVLYDEALARPTCVSVDVEATYDAEKGEGLVRVSGHVAEAAMGDEELYVTVYLLEDNVYTDSQEQSDLGKGDYIHNNVVRLRLTPMFGEPLNWGEQEEGVYNGDYFNMFDYFVEPEWKLEDMRIVAVVSRNMEKNGYRNANVMNCAECSLSGFSGIQSLRLDTDARRVFDLLGRQVTRVGKLSRGVYVVDGKKVIVR